MLQNAEAAYYSESRKSPELFAETRDSTVKKRIQLSVPTDPMKQGELIAAALVNEDGENVRRMLSEEIMGFNAKFDFSHAEAQLRAVPERGRPEGEGGLRDEGKYTNSEQLLS